MREDVACQRILLYSLIIFTLGGPEAEGPVGSCPPPRVCRYSKENRSRNKQSVSSAPPHSFGPSDASASFWPPLSRLYDMGLLYTFRLMKIYPVSIHNLLQIAKSFYSIKYGSSNITSIVSSNNSLCFMSFQMGFLKQSVILAFFYIVLILI